MAETRAPTDESPAAGTERPDAIELMSAQFDRNEASAAKKTLIICAAPRTGSYELCRFLLLAGVGVPHEYFHWAVAPPLAARWGLGSDPLAPANIDRYVAALRRRRAAGNVFATKLQYHQFLRYLRNRHGAALFEDATVVHLFRPDIVAQFDSWRRAGETGIWDHTNRITIVTKIKDDNELRRKMLELAMEDAAFRQVFLMLGIRPLFLTTEELFAAPRAAVERIARRLDVAVDSAGLDAAIAVSARYAHAPLGANSDPAIATPFKDYVFSNAPLLPLK